MRVALFAVLINFITYISRSALTHINGDSDLGFF